MTTAVFFFFTSIWRTFRWTLSDENTETWQEVKALFLFSSSVEPPGGEIPRKLLKQIPNLRTETYWPEAPAEVRRNKKRLRLGKSLKMKKLVQQLIRCIYNLCTQRGQHADHYTIILQGDLQLLFTASHIYVITLSLQRNPTSKLKPYLTCHSVLSISSRLSGELCSAVNYELILSSEAQNKTVAAGS